MLCSIILRHSMSDHCEHCLLHPHSGEVKLTLEMTLELTTIKRIYNLRILYSSELNVPVFELFELLYVRVTRLAQLTLLDLALLLQLFTSFSGPYHHNERSYWLVAASFVHQNRDYTFRTCGFCSYYSALKDSYKCFHRLHIYIIFSH